MTEATDVFDDALLASVYDDHNPWAASDEFYLGLAREIGGAVLDLGCGRLACRIAAAGLEVVGADPAAGRGGYGHRRDRPALPFLDLGLDGGLARIGRSRIRFIERDHLAGLLARAGLVAAARYGDWHRGAFTPTSKEIIAVTRRAG